MSKLSVLILEDEFATLTLLNRIVEQAGHNVFAASEPTVARELLLNIKPDLFMTDLMLPGCSGIDLLKDAQSISPQTMTVVFTASDKLDTAVEAMKIGAIDYLQKPLSRESINALLERVTKQVDLKDENRRLKQQLGEKDHHFHGIIGKSRAMERVFEQIKRVSETNANVLIHGESGTGKEMIAQAIHACSSRKSNELVAVDCVALPTNLIESELFGYEKGAFTGADMARDGLLKAAHNGTFFMDEITELDYNLQAKLLRVLQERQFRPVGGRDVIDVDTRIVAATRRDPLEAVKDGIFREDLYYRLNVFPIELPPLRERNEDIPVLVHHFLSQFKTDNNMDVSISAEAMGRLQSYNWPGNIRELKNIVERSAIMASDGKIELDDLPENIVHAGKVSTNFVTFSYLPFKEAKRKWVQSFEIKYLEELLGRNRWNLSESARQSGINRKTLQRLVAKHKIPDPRPRYAHKNKPTDVI